MKNSKWLLVAGLAIMLMTIGCEKQMGFIAPEGDVGVAATSTLPIQYNPGGSWFTYFNYMPPVAAPGVDYLMSIGNDAGNNGLVRLWNDATNLYVEYHALNGWKVSQVHVAVALDLDGIPHNKSGNMTPGDFPYPPKTEFNVVPPSDVHLVTIPWDTDWNNPPDPGLFIVTHCIVFWVDPITGDTTWQTGTGADTTKLYKDVKLPTGLVNYSATHPYPSSGSVPPLDSAFWDVLLWNVPVSGGPYNVWNGHWKGWCTEHNVDYYGWPMSVTLVSSQDPDLSTHPRLWKNGEWDRINWLLNHKSLFPTARYTNFQNAFYLILGDILPNNPKIEPLDITIADAAAAGDGYQVPLGGWVAVLLWDGYETPHAFPSPEGVPQTVPNDQLIFIEVDP